MQSETYNKVLLSHKFYAVLKICRRAQRYCFNTKCYNHQLYPLTFQYI